ncbi:MAG: glucose-1-phosphate adenylyltransferase subunit GlgD [Enterococcus sp.]
MRTNKMCAILGNLHRYDELLPLTNERPLAALPFDCKYRLLDFNLSSIANANIHQLFMVFNEGETQSVFDHLGGGKDWGLDGVQNRYFTYVYQDFIQQKAEKKHYYSAIVDFLKKSKSEYTVFMGSKMLCNIDLRAVQKIHQHQGNEMTVVYKRVAQEKVYHSDILLDLDENGHIKNASVASEKKAQDELVNLCTDIYIVQTNRLIEELVKGEKAGATANLESFLRSKINEFDSASYEYTGYLSNIFDIQSYYQTNMDMLDQHHFSALLYSNQKIYTKLKNEVPTYYAESSKVSNSQFASGCVINGEITNSLISRSTKVAHDAKVSDSIIMASNKIHENAEVQYAILDKNVTVDPGVKIIGTKENPIVVKKGSHVKEDLIKGA